MSRLRKPKLEWNDVMERDSNLRGTPEDTSRRSETPLSNSGGGVGGPRAEKSLSLLTQRFLELLQEAPDGIVDLNVAADRLMVKQKRRIYDITNVLEGVGLIQKKTKNVIQWKGERMGGDERERLVLKERMTEVEELAEAEHTLDTHIQWLKQSMRNVTETRCNQDYAYTSCDDVSGSFAEKTVVAIQAPPGTSVEVPLPFKDQHSLMKYQMRLQSTTGAVNVMLVNKEDRVEQTQLLLESLENARLQRHDDHHHTDDQEQGPSTLTPPPMIRTRSKRKLEEEASNYEQDTLASSQDSIGSDTGPLIKKTANPVLCRQDSSQSSQELPSLSQSASQRSVTLSQEVKEVLLRLSPPPSERDYLFNLGDGDSLNDLFPSQRSSSFNK